MRLEFEIKNRMYMSFAAVLFCLALFAGVKAQAYHHFIGYGYGSCITCHYNGAGGGSLNDYGRALFAAEISSRWIIPKSVEDDKLGEYSRFLVVTDLPYWVRPGFKHRSLSIEQDPGSGAKRKFWYTMQNEASLTLAADPDNKYIFVGSMTLNKAPRSFSTGSEDRPVGDNWAMKEAYFRIQLNDTSWVYAGQLDKVFGLREVNHSGVSRVMTGLRQYDQSLGLIYQKSEMPWEYFLGVFNGNTGEQSIDRWKGVSSLFEYELFEKLRLGFSFLTEKSEVTEKRAVALHQRWGVGHGSALSTELGVVDNKTLNSPNAPTQPGYLFLQSLIHISRGYNFLGEVEMLKTDLKVGSPQIWKWGMGFLIFPLPRFEYRLGAVNVRSYSSEIGSAESWALQSQLHWSL